MTRLNRGLPAPRGRARHCSVAAPGPACRSCPCHQSGLYPLQAAQESLHRAQGLAFPSGSCSKSSVTFCDSPPPLPPSESCRRLKGTCSAESDRERQRQRTRRRGREEGGRETGRRETRREAGTGRDAGQSSAPGPLTEKTPQGSNPSLSPNASPPARLQGYPDSPVAPAVSSAITS